MSTEADEQTVSEPEVNLRVTLDEATFIMGFLSAGPYHTVAALIDKLSAQVTYQTGCKTAREMLEALSTETATPN